MKYNEIMPECFIDSTLVESLLDAKVSHKHSCNEVAKLQDVLAYLAANKYNVDMEELKKKISS